MAGILDDHHRMFIQAFMWKKICSSNEVKSLFKKCHENNNVPLSELKPFVEKINSALRPINMMITKGIDELNGEQYYILMNTTDNDISRLSSDYKTNEIELFKKIINGIVESGEGKVTTMAVLNLSDEVHITKKEANEIIIKLSQDGWINENEGYISFSTRAIAELQYFFKEHFKEAIVLCNLCKNVVFQGDVCNNCETKLHLHCKTNYFADTRRNNCPSCRTPWNE